MMICGQLTLICVLLLLSGCSAQSREFLIRNIFSKNCIDVDGDPGVADLDNVQSSTCEFEKSNSDQIWVWDSDQRLQSKPSGKCLDLEGYGNPENGLNINLFSCQLGDDQTWQFNYESGTDHFQIQNTVTGKCLDVAGNRDFTSGANIIQYDCEAYTDPDTDQWWEAISPTGFFLRNKATMNCIDVWGSPAVDDGDNIGTHTGCQGGIDDRVWSWDSDQRLHSNASGKCMELAGAKDSADGVNVQLWTCLLEDDHSWQFIYEPGTEYFQVQNLATGKCLDVEGDQVPDNANIVQQPCQPYNTSLTDQWWDRFPENIPASAMGSTETVTSSQP